MAGFFEVNRSAWAGMTRAVAVRGALVWCTQLKDFNRRAHATGAAAWLVGAGLPAKAACQPAF